MKKDDTTNQNTQNLNAQLSDLLDEAKEINREIDSTNKGAQEEIAAIDSKVDDSVAKLEHIYSDLDQIEKEAGDEFDKLALQHAEDLAAE